MGVDVGFHLVLQKEIDVVEVFIGIVTVIVLIGIRMVRQTEISALKPADDRHSESEHSLTA